MHPKNPFKDRYDLQKIKAKYSALAEFIHINKHGIETIDFSNSKAVLALNSGLFKTYFDTDWSIPKGQLCPPVPSRMDYLLYVNDLVGKEQVNLLDVGCGASLVYPIVATQYLKWSVSASDIDASSLAHAESIARDNDFDVDLRKQENSNHVFKGIINPDDKFDVSVCNPPFHKSQEEALKANQRKNRNLKISQTENFNFGGVSNELWYPGGEVAFIIKLIDESKEFRSQVKWFTTLVSRKDNLRPILRQLKKSKPRDFKVVEMTTGNKISRFLAWTYQRV